MLDHVLSHHVGVVIAPMTIVEPSYYEETIGQLRSRGHDVRHFALLADHRTVLHRLRERGFGHAVQLVVGKGAPLLRESFAVSKLEFCLARLSGPEFAEHVWTDDITISEVAEQIALSAGLTLTPNTDSVLRGVSAERGRVSSTFGSTNTRREPAPTCSRDDRTEYCVGPTGGRPTDLHCR